MVESSKTKVFITWSGPLARAIARALYGWLQELFDGIEPFMSDENIDSGQRSMNVIEEGLAGTRFGIIVTTRANMEASWLNFEAGAISKVVREDVEQRVAPYLIDFSHTAEVVGPITQFQMKMADKEGTLRLVQDLGKVMGTRPESVKSRFEKFWPDLKTKLDEAKGKHADSDAPAKRGMQSMVEETLELVRSMRNDTIGPAASWAAWTDVLAAEPDATARRLFTVKSASRVPLSEKSKRDLVHWKRHLNDDATRVEELVELHCEHQGIPAPAMFIDDLDPASWSITVVFAPGTTEEQMSRVEALIRLETSSRNPAYRFARVSDE